MAAADLQSTFLDGGFPGSLELLYALLALLKTLLRPTKQLTAKASPQSTQPTAQQLADTLKQSPCEHPGLDRIPAALGLLFGSGGHLIVDLRDHSHVLRLRQRNVTFHMMCHLMTNNTGDSRRIACHLIEHAGKHGNQINFAGKCIHIILGADDHSPGGFIQVVGPSNPVNNAIDSIKICWQFFFGATIDCIPITPHWSRLQRGCVGENPHSAYP